MSSAFPATEEDWDIAGRTVFGEARGQESLGQIAVAWVIRNRAEHPSWWGHTLSEVCKKPWQFSVWNAGDPNLPIIQAAHGGQPLFRRAMGFVALVLSGDFADPTDGATHYHTVQSPELDQAWPPAWTRNPDHPMKKTTTIGAHTFYRAFRPGEIA